MAIATFQEAQTVQFSSKDSLLGMPATVFSSMKEDLLLRSVNMEITERIDVLYGREDISMIKEMPVKFFDSQLIAMPEAGIGEPVKFQGELDTMPQWLQETTFAETHHS